ncbi:hypothetical protein GS399_17845 [Pedobacter sp. HMF7647]|uniref:Soluble ligand binding domain-containing protein n=1 Tax=Hufsiella arboris TaxID=2695275 RepID=A0A7K1YFT1_9SPHI|nr:polysaccharide biosynthesis/export family protein [Hufsiella arboris]MXV52839.1 hypothetical protein [Hufsiella arboris]
MVRLKVKTTLLLFSIITVFLSSCAVRKKQALFTAPSDLVTDTIKHVYVVNDHGESDSWYKIKANDLLAIQNLQNQEFGSTGAATTTASATPGNNSNSVTYPVEQDGSVNLPAIGKVEVAGLSRRQATMKIQDLYEKKLLKNPIIQLTVVNLKVTLLGEFSKQGNYLLTKDNTTLIDIIGEAGGISATADPKTVKIIRGDRANPEIIYVNLNDINSLASKKLVLQNDDIVYIQPTKSAALNSKVQNINTIVQPLLTIVNLALVILTFSRL